MHLFPRASAIHTHPFSISVFSVRQMRCDRSSIGTYGSIPYNHNVGRKDVRYFVGTYTCLMDGRIPYPAIAINYHCFWVPILTKYYDRLLANSRKLRTTVWYSRISSRRHFTRAERRQYRTYGRELLWKYRVGLEKYYQKFEKNLRIRKVVCILVNSNNVRWNEWIGNLYLKKMWKKRGGGGQYERFFTDFQNAISKLRTIHTSSRVFYVSDELTNGHRKLWSKFHKLIMGIFFINYKSKP